jgi:transcriptional regulator with XRE-family HTH domain
VLLTDRLLSARKRMKLSRQSVASLIGVDRESIRNWESGRAIPNALNIARIARVYSKPMEHFFARELNDTRAIKRN